MLTVKEVIEFLSKCRPDELVVVCADDRIEDDEEINVRLVTQAITGSMNLNGGHDVAIFVLSGGERPAMVVTD